MCSINHNLKAIYIHIPKNGGVFIEHILKKYYDFEFDYCIKRNNYGFNSSSETPSIDFQNFGVLRYYINSEYINEKYNMNIEKWKSYYKFTFVRNPYTRIISAYEYTKEKFNKFNNNNDSFPSFEDFFKNQKHGFNSEIYINRSRLLYYYHYYHSFITQTDHLTNNNNELDINFIGNFENINSELIEILKNLGVKNYHKHVNEINSNLILNSSNKINNKYFTQSLLDYFNSFFHNDFINFNFEKITSISEINNLNIDTKNTIINNNALLLKTLNFSKIQIFDNFLDCVDIILLQNIIKSNKWSHGHKSSSDSLFDNSFLYMELMNNVFCYKYIKLILEKTLNVSIHINRLYAIGQSFGQDGSYHIDDKSDNAFTCCIYISQINIPELNMYIGGNLLIKEPTNKNITCIEPLYNRAAIFPSNLYHVGTSYTKYINALRTCVVLKFFINS